MTTKDRASDRGRREAARHLQTIATELREARLAAGLSQTQVGRAAGISHAAVSRIERALAPNVSLGRIDTMAAVLGLQLGVRLYPVGRPLRDAGQLALLERLRVRLAPGLVWRRESPVPIAGDLRAWDASIDGDGWTVYVDAETGSAMSRPCNGEPRSNAATREPTGSSSSSPTRERTGRSWRRCPARW